MGLFAKFKAGLQKTHSKLTHEIKRIVTRSPKLEGATLEELEAALIGASRSGGIVKTCGSACRALLPARRVADDADVFATVLAVVKSWGRIRGGRTP